MIGFGTNVLPNSDEEFRLIQNKFRLADMIWADVEQQPHSANEANRGDRLKVSVVSFTPWGQSVVGCARG